MLYMRLALMGLGLSIFGVSYAQFSDDFSDGEIHHNPTWLGDTTDFIVNDDQRLQLNAEAVTGEKFIYTHSEAIENAVWEFEVYLAFNPSSTNYTDIYLVADQPNHLSVSGYFVRVGNTQDEISLYRQDGTARAKIIDGRDKVIDASNIAVRVRVTRNKEGHWELFSDIDILGNFTKEGEVFDDTYISSAYFGFLCKYTATRSRLFSFDNISVTGSPKSDVFPPQVHTVNVVNESSISLVFSEKITLNSQNPGIHFLENCQLSQPTSVEMINDSSVTLRFSDAFPENKDCRLLVNDVHDRARNKMEEASINFRYVPPRQPVFNELLITEIMADESPAVDLPEYEYLEIYNPLDEKLTVRELELRVRSDSKIIRDFEIEPGEYIILCPNPALEQFEAFGKAIGVPSWRALLNNGDTLSLYNRYQEQIFSMAYHKSWYTYAEKSDGGYSLEMVDINNPCGEMANWTASESPEGGTPGAHNSVAASKPDLMGPLLVGAFPLSPYAVRVEFDEKVVGESLALTKMKVDPTVEISHFSVAEPLRKSITLNLKDSLNTKQEYTLTIAGAKDCAGNLAKDNKASFVLPENADSLDILFNELMFNPLSGSKNFVELVNVSDKYIDLKGWKLLRERDGEVIEEVSFANDHLMVKPGDIFVVTEDRNLLIAQYPHSSEATIIEARTPQMNNDEGVVILANREGNFIDRVYYHEDYHHHAIRNKKGVSLERISYSAGGSDNPEIWQSAASTVGFATPGRKNSQYFASQIEKPFSIDPPVFNPNNDGYKDFTTFNFELDNYSYLASLFIYDLSGRVVRQLLNNQNLPLQGHIVWEGDDDHGNKVPIGNYIVYFELIGQSGEKKRYKDKVAVAAWF